MDPLLPYFVATGYLLVGCLVMLVLNEVFPRHVDEQRFVLGMTLWPLLVTLTLGGIALRYWQRGLSRD